MLKQYFTKYLAKKHIAGGQLKDALVICDSAAQYNWSNTISVWTSKDAGIEDNMQCYIEILNAILKCNFNSYISIKPSAINFNIKLFETLAGIAISKNIRIHFDSLSPDLADSYLSFLKDSLSIYRNIGYTLPARWHRSLKDAQLISKYNIPVRIVKGQWPNPGNERIDPKDNYLNLVKALSGKVPLIEIATHDRSVAEKAIDIITKDESDFELGQFFSLPLKAEKISSKFKNIKKRLYVVYGEPYLPYTLRSANRRPEMVLWILRDLLNLKPNYMSDFSNNKNSQSEAHELISHKITG